MYLVSEVSALRSPFVCRFFRDVGSVLADFLPRLCCLCLGGRCHRLERGGGDENDKSSHSLAVHQSLNLPAGNGVS